MVASDPVVTQLRTAPGIGPVTAVAFVATLDVVTRVTSAHQVDANLESTPQEYSSGERKRRGRKQKRYGSHERRGQLAGKRPLTARPGIVAARGRVGDWEIDTMAGTGERDCVLSLVERKTGYLLLEKLANRTATAIRQRAIQLLRAQRRRGWTVTADNGTEFHQYGKIEQAVGVPVYFAPPYQAWRRGSCENTNGLVRQYLPKGRSLAGLTQADCSAIARQLNQRPRKRHRYRTPEACYGLHT